jgi:hypothetical protein
MGRRAYGKGSSSEDASLRMQLLQLLQGGGGNKGAGKGGGGKGGGRQGGAGDGGGARGGAASASAGWRLQNRLGDWDCANCRFPNFAFRTSCYQCGVPAARGAAARSGGGLAQERGPAHGPGAERRPTSVAEARNAARRAGEPSFRVPRADGARSAGARPEAPRGAPRGGDVGADGATTAAGASQREHGEAVDATRVGGLQSAGAAGTSERGVCIGGTSRRRWADDATPRARARAGSDDDSEYADEDEVMAVDEEDDQELDDDGWVHKPTVESLRSRWAQECRAVKALERVERDGDQGPTAALQAARLARDRAEQDWRDALSPKPVSVRMGYAQKKLDRAQRSVDRAEADLRSFEEEAERRRAELQDIVAQAEGRRDMRQRELDALHKEAGELAAASSGEAWQSNPSPSGAERTLDILAKGLQALVEDLAEGSPARERANLLLAKAANVPSPLPHQHYTIYTDGEEHGGDADGGAAATTNREEAGRPAQRSGRREATWRPAANGRWDKNHQRDGAGTTAAATATTTATAPATPTTTTPSVEGGTAKPPGAAAAPVQARAGARPREESPAAAPPNKQHRGHDEELIVSVEGGGDDQQRARKLQQEQQQAVAAALSANATFGDEQARQIAGQLYAHKVELAKARAAAVGVEAAIDGRPLIELAPDRFTAWITEVLEPAERDAKEEKDL